VINCYFGGVQMRYLAAAGMLRPMDDKARELGFTPDQTYPAMRPSLMWEGRQYVYPRVASIYLYWVNRNTFEQCDQPIPPRRMSIEEFEQRGLSFIEAANPPGERVTTFFADSVRPQELRRSMGLSTFNETLSRCTLDDARNARTLELIRRWTHDLHILPSAADRAEFVTAGGWGAQMLQFADGRFGMLASGRWALMILRQVDPPIPMAAVELPHGGFPNVLLGGAQSAVYAASDYPELSSLYLAYTTSDIYNLQIVETGDALPPNPKFGQVEAFRRPPDHPNEWGCHEVFFESAESIAIVNSFSPFVLPAVVRRIDQASLDKVMTGWLTAEQAAADAANRINVAITRNVAEDPALAEPYAQALERQKRIDAARAAGRPVPRNWIDNPFHQRWYEHNGWLGESRPDGSTEASP
jgi:multiple sugar transport system substrate-binding protein